MKKSIRLACAVAISLGIGLWNSTPTRASNVAVSAGFHGGGSSFYGGYHGGSSMGYYGGYRGGYYGGYHGGYYGYGRNSVALSFSFGYAGPAYYNYGSYYPAAYYYPPAYYSAPVYYSSPAVYAAPPSSTAAYYSAPAPAPTVIQNSTSAPSNNEGQSMRPADVVALVKSGLSDEVIVSQIRSSKVTFHLSTAEIIDLKNSGVSDKVINFMINTATS
jgi:hypothetical protein